MTHIWGSDWEHWDDLYKAVDRCTELADVAGFETWHIKEKWGGLRWYARINSDEDAVKYRDVYRTLIAEFPHLTVEILSNADYFREHLVGLVAEKDCKADHANYWSSSQLVPKFSWLAQLPPRRYCRNGILRRLDNWWNRCLFNRVEIRWCGCCNKDLTPKDK